MEWIQFDQNKFHWWAFCGKFDESIVYIKGGGILDQLHVIS